MHPNTNRGELVEILGDQVQGKVIIFNSFSFFLPSTHVIITKKM